VIVCFVDIGGIVDHHYLNLLFIIFALYQICYFGADRKSNMAARANNVF
jgi:hypothetical protein